MAKNYYWILIVLMSVAGKVFSKASWCAVTGLLAALAPTARAILTGSTSNTTSSGTPPWNYVGSIGGLSGVYLGNYGSSGWVLTAAHVGAGSFTLGSTTFTATGTSFSNFSYNGSVTDLTLFEINSMPSLPNLSLALPLSGSTVEMIGFGSVKSWGDNTIYGYTSNYALSSSSAIDRGPGIITLASGLNGQGGQGVSGDSGGGMFFEDTNTNTWYLTGILSAAGDLGNSLGNGTIAVPVAVYVAQISADLNSTVNAIPEPSSYGALCSAGAFACAVLWRRRKWRA